MTDPAAWLTQDAASPVDARSWTPPDSCAAMRKPGHRRRLVDPELTQGVIA
jgi:hypothetical protein